MRTKISLLAVLMLLGVQANAQKFLMDMVDTSTDLGKGMLSVYQKFGSINFTGYIQPQFQWAEGKGVKNYSGGDFAANSNNRFMLRRSRIRVDYAHSNKRNELSTYFVFQFDATERGVFVRDVWGRIFDNKWKLFSLTTGLMARPFGYEVNLGSGDRESPERGRMSQSIMKVERDLGVMLNFEPRNATSGFMKHIKADVGVFNGPGLVGTMDFDSYKDIIGRVYSKPVIIKSANIEITGGASVLYGAIGGLSPWLYTTQNSQNGYKESGDSSQSNINAASPRRYYGADMQIKHTNKKWATEIRGEYIFGTQTGTATSSETPGAVPVNAANAPMPLYQRSFNGAYFYFLQNIAGNKHQLVVKYDWYDPNAMVSGTQINAAKGFSSADVKFNTLGVGYVYYVNPHLKATFFYEMINNESTGINGFNTDIRDNIFTCRLQYRF